MKMRMKLWLEKDGEMAFGPGPAAILREVERTGSLAGAARALGMSYRTAWGRMKKLENALGTALVAKKGGNKAGSTLTAYGQVLLEAYEAWEASVRAEAAKKAEELFPFPVEAKR
jgi:molybdate transport system regulatory protein